MDSWEALKTKLEETIIALKVELSGEIAIAKNNEILSAIKDLNNRLLELEKRLPPIEED